MSILTTQTHSTDEPSRLQRLDHLGATGSLLCAVHCALWPLLLILVPALGLSFLADPLFERGFVLFAAILATLSLLPGYRRHRAPWALLCLFPGLAAVIFGAFDGSAHQGWLHALLMTSGGVLIAAAHLINLHLSRRNGPCMAVAAG